MMKKSKPRKHTGSREPIPVMKVAPVRKVKRPKDKLREEILDEMIRDGD